MCLAIPGKVKEVNGHKALIEYPKEVRKAFVGDDPIKVGDFVLVQMGIVTRTLSKKERDASAAAWGSS